MNASKQTILNVQETIADILRRRAAWSPNKTAYIYLRDGENDEQILTYGELDLKARHIAAVLQAGKCRGKRVLLMYSQGLEFITAFFGCIYAGAVAVLLYPPTNERMASRMKRIISDCSVFRILTNQEIANQLNRLVRRSRSPALIKKESLEYASTGLNGFNCRTNRLMDIPLILTDLGDLKQNIKFKDEIILSEDLAFLQYTSGHTGTPKGVMVSHGNIIANQQAIKHFFWHTSASCTVSWLPMLHGMGLIGCTLQPLYVGYPLIFMSPLHFIQRPVRWLWAITKYCATSSGGPNFAFDYCVSKISDEDKHSLDLSSWKVAFNGSESVRYDTMNRFKESFSSCGLNSNALIGVYGTAETTLIVTGTQPGIKVPVDKNTGYVSSGRVAPFHKLKIVDPKMHCELPYGAIGEIWVNGPSITKGYWGHPEINAEIFEATLAGNTEKFLRTGDMGYLQDGHIFVTGRIKDPILVKDRNCRGLKSNATKMYASVQTNSIYK